MTKIDIIPSAHATVPTSLSELELARRLIVLIPDMELDHIPAMGRIWELANAQHAHVLLLSLCKDAKQESSLRRSLITMSAMVQDGYIPAEVKVEMRTNWVDIVKRIYEPGDMIVCFAEQRAGVLQKPLSQILQSDLKIPVYVLSGLYQPKPRWSLLSQITAWMGFLGILAGFFVLQINIIQSSKGGLESILLILSLIPEYWLIIFWNSLLG